MPAKFAGAQGAGPPPIFVRYWMRRVWTVAIVPALFDGVFALRVASMASWGRLWAGGGGRGGVLSVFASGGRMAVCPGGATAVRSARLRGLYRAREAYWTRRRAESHSQDAKRSSFTKSAAALASVLRPLATSERRESPSTVQYNPGTLPDPSQGRRS